jgi:hypothetical protein
VLLLASITGSGPLASQRRDSEGPEESLLAEDHCDDRDCREYNDCHAILELSHPDPLTCIRAKRRSKLRIQRSIPYALDPGMRSHDFRVHRWGEHPIGAFAAQVGPGVRI